MKDAQFHYGIGRERFPALLEPEFIAVEDAAVLRQDTDRFLVVTIGDDTRAYSVKDLTRHEVVNDVIDGKPVFASLLRKVVLLPQLHQSIQIPDDHIAAIEMDNILST